MNSYIHSFMEKKIYFYIVYCTLLLPMYHKSMVITGFIVRIKKIQNKINVFIYLFLL